MADPARTNLLIGKRLTASPGADRWPAVFRERQQISRSAGSAIPSSHLALGIIPMVPLPTFTCYLWVFRD